MKDAVEHPTYQQNLITRLHAGILPPNMEIRVLEYVYGKPAEEIDLTMHQDFSSKSTEELIQVAANLQEELKRLFSASKAPVA